MNARSVRTLIRNSSSLLSIAYDYGRPYPVDIIQRRAISRTIRDDQLSANHLMPQLVYPIRTIRNNKASLVIFDKDGTLICFHSMWVPWARNVTNWIMAETKLRVADEIYALLGFNDSENRVRSGLLAEGTMAQIRDAIARLLISHGIQASDAVSYVKRAIMEADKRTTHTVKEIADLRCLFEQLRDNGVKIAICTSDSRRGTLKTLKTLQVEHFVDVVVCGDDAGAMPKPHPHNALSICRVLDIDPQEALVVGDTLADMGMGRSANLGGTVGVLSGICGNDELRPHADHVVRDVGELLPIVLDMRRSSLF
uniref:Uncharacterized protein n=1 Tax=Parascaris univalens TaxID=6257 RepID=A0A915C401_PARUN